MTTSRETTAGLALRWLRLTLILIFIAAAILGGLFLIAYTYGVNPGIAGKTAEAVTSGTWTGIVLATAIALFIASVRMIGRLVDRVPMLFLEGPPAFASVASAYSSLVGAKEMSHDITNIEIVALLISFLSAACAILVTIIRRVIAANQRC